MRGWLPVLLLLFAGGKAGAQGVVVPLVREGARLYADMQVQDSIPVRAILDAGVSNSLIDLALARQYPALFPLEKLENPLPVQVVGGIECRAEYKLASGLEVAGTRSLCEVYAVDLEGQNYRMVYPLHAFTTDTVASPGVFMLDIRHGQLTVLSPEERPQGDLWPELEMQCNDESGMFFVSGALQIANDAGVESLTKLDFTLDLGGGSLLVLLAYKPFVGMFAQQACIPTLWEGTSQGLEMRVLKPAVTTFFGQYPFSDQPVILLDRPIQVSGDGLLGLPFFDAFRVVLDFRHQKLLLTPAADWPTV